MFNPSLLFILCLFSTASSYGDIEPPKGYEELKKNRSKIFKIKNKVYIGVEPIDEAKYNKKLSQFILSLKEDVKNKDAEAFVSKISKKMTCYDPDYAKSAHSGGVGFDHCSKVLKIGSKKFWSDIKETLDDGGCFHRKQFVLPSIFFCDRGNKKTLELSGKRFRTMPLDIYEKPKKSAKKRQLDKYLFFKETGLSISECKKLGLPDFCRGDWSRVETDIGISGYTLVRDLGPNWSAYKYSVFIDIENGEFKIVAIGSPYLLE